MAGPAAGGGCGAAASAQGWGGRGALSSAEKCSLNLEETPLVPPCSLGGQLGLGQTLRGLDAGRRYRGLLQCHCGHADALVFQCEGCGEAQRPQAEVHPVQTSISSAAAVK